MRSSINIEALGNLGLSGPKSSPRAARSRPSRPYEAVRQSFVLIRARLSKVGRRNAAPDDSGAVDALQRIAYGVPGLWP